VAAIDGSLAKLGTPGAAWIRLWNRYVNRWPRATLLPWNVDH
jgi:hypothetical protein